MQKGWLKKLGFWTLVNIAVLFVLAIVFGREYIGNQQIQRTIAQVQEDMEELEAQQSSTLRFIDYLSSETYLEEEGRRQGLGKEGETLLVVQLPEEEVVEVDDEEQSYIVHWFHYFFTPDDL